MESVKTKPQQNYDTSMSWKMIEKYFDGHHLERLVRHQIESYNNFINKHVNQSV